MLNDGGKAAAGGLPGFDGLAGVNGPAAMAAHAAAADKSVVTLGFGCAPVAGGVRRGGLGFG